VLWKVILNCLPMSCLYPTSSVAALALLTSICVAFISSPTHSAASSPERIALQLKGSLCRSQHANILSTLSPLPGVRAIDLSSVPGHVLVDIDTDVLSAQHLVESVRRLWHNEDACLVEPMQSCISAGPLGHVDRPSADHAAMAH
jgi:hypothetical protein